MSTQSVRKKQRERHYKWLFLWAEEMLTFTQIAKRYHTTPQAVHKAIHHLLLRINAHRESSMLMNKTRDPDSELSLPVHRRVLSMTEDFLAHVSPAKGDLTDEEKVFVMVGVTTGDWELALQEAGLDASKIPTTSGAGKSVKAKTDKVRASYLRYKRNIVEAIEEAEHEVRQKAMKVDKDFIVVQLSDLIAKMRLNPEKNQKDLLQAIKLLGQTQGAFKEVIQHEEVDPNEVFDEILAEYTVEDKSEEDT